MTIIQPLLSDIAVIGGIILVSIGIGGRAPLIVGICLIVLGLLV